MDVCHTMHAPQEMEAAAERREDGLSDLAKESLSKSDPLKTSSSSHPTSFEALMIDRDRLLDATRALMAGADELRGRIESMEARLSSEHSLNQKVDRLAHVVQEMSSHFISELQLSRAAHVDHLGHMVNELVGSLEAKVRPNLLLTTSTLAWQVWISV